MSELNKIFTLVQPADQDAFVAKYIRPAEGQPRYTDYDQKIVFLAKTYEIFTAGRIFGINTLDDIKWVCNNYIGAIPQVEGVTTVIGYINYMTKEVYDSVESISEDTINELFVYAPQN